MTAKTEKAVLKIDPEIDFSLSQLYADSVAWFSSHYWELIIAGAIGTGIFFVLGGLKRLAARHVRGNEGYTGYRTVMLGAIAKTSKLFMLAVAAKVIVIFGQAPETVRDTVNVIFTLAAVIQIAIWLRELILGFFTRKLSHDPHEHETLESAMTLIKLLVTFVIFAIAFIVVLDNLGVDVTGLVAGLGVGGIAIGLAAQGIFSDLFAALSIIFDKPFRRGDVIHYDDTTGTVQKIGLKSTRLQAVGGEELIISNTNLLDKEITNWNNMNYRRERMQIGVIYQTPPEEAARIPGLLQEIVEAHDAKFVRSGFVGFGDSSIDFQFDMDFTETGFDVMYAKRHAIGLAILKKFNDEGFEFAYPTQTTFTSAPDGTMIMPYPEGGFGVLDVKGDT